MYISIFFYLPKLNFICGIFYFENLLLQNLGPLGQLLHFPTKLSLVLKHINTRTIFFFIL